MSEEVNTIKAENMYCPNCGTKISGDSLFCFKCGSRIKKDESGVIKAEALQGGSTSIDETPVMSQKEGKKQKNTNLVIPFFVGGIVLVAIICIVLISIFSKRNDKMPINIGDNNETNENNLVEATINPQDNHITEENETQNNVKENEEDKESERKDESDEAISEDESIVANEAEEIKRAKVCDYYGCILAEMCLYNRLPEIGELEEDTSDWSVNKFAIYDIDGDGREELLIDYTSTYMAGVFGVVYDYDLETDKIKTEQFYYPCDYEFYDNGILIEPISHNQSGMEFWPYTMYKYDPDSDTYKEIAFVSTWEKAVEATNYEGESFPESYDKDGDGVLYSILEENINSGGGDASTFCYDKADYEKWYNGQLENAKKLQLDMKTIDYKSTEEYMISYRSKVIQKVIKDIPQLMEDIGVETYDKEYFVKSAKDYLTEKCDYGITFHDSEEYEGYEDFGDFKVADYEGEEVFEAIDVDAGSLIYKEKKVGNITLFGLYPGMGEKEAKEMMERFGFYPLEGLENEYITGNAFGNSLIRLQVAEGKITWIDLSPYCAYAG